MASSPTAEENDELMDSDELMKTVIPADKTQSHDDDENGDDDDLDEDELDEMDDEVGELMGTDEYDDSSDLKAAYQALLNGDDEDEPLEKLESSLQEDSDDDGGDFFGNTMRVQDPPPDTEITIQVTTNQVTDTLDDSTMGTLDSDTMGTMDSGMMETVIPNVNQDDKEKEETKIHDDSGTMGMTDSDVSDMTLMGTQDSDTMGTMDSDMMERFVNNVDNEKETSEDNAEFGDEFPQNVDEGCVDSETMAKVTITKTERVVFKKGEDEDVSLEENTDGQSEENTETEEENDDEGGRHGDEKNEFIGKNIDATESILQADDPEEEEEDESPQEVLITITKKEEVSDDTEQEEESKNDTGSEDEQNEHQEETVEEKEESEQYENQEENEEPEQYENQEETVELGEEAKEKEYPEFIINFQEKLFTHYVSKFTNEVPIKWLKVKNKPEAQKYLDLPLVDKTSSDVVTLADLKVTPGERIVVEGGPGSGKTTLLHKIVHDRGLNLLPSLEHFKLVFYLDANRWRKDANVYDAIKTQAIQEAWEICHDELFTWMDENEEELLFVVDGVDENPDLDMDHAVMQLAEGELFRQSAVIYAMRPKKALTVSVFSHHHYKMGTFSEDQIHEYLDTFILNKNEKFLKLTEKVSANQKIVDFYAVPLHTAFIATLFTNDAVEIESLPQTPTELLDKVFIFALQLIATSSTEKPMSDNQLIFFFEDLAFDVARLALDGLQSNRFSYSKNELSQDLEMETKFLDHLLEFGFLEKSVCVDEYYFPYKYFQEFLAAKFIAIQYFNVSNSVQVGVKTDLKETEKLFDLCWSCYSDDYKYETICVFVSGLLCRDYCEFVEALGRSIELAPSSSAKEACLNTACACITENSTNRGLINCVADNIASKGGIEFDLIQTEMNGCLLEGLGHLVATGKLPMLNLSSLNAGSVERARPLVKALTETDNLRSLSIDLTNFDPTVSGTIIDPDQADFSVLKSLVKALNQSTVKELKLEMQLDVMCLKAIELASGIFLSVLSDLKSLSLHVNHRNFNSYFSDIPNLKDNIHTFENLNILVARFRVFLENNASVEHLDLGGCFLHKDVLPEISDVLVKHPGLRSLGISGQKNGGAPIHREGVEALSFILQDMKLEEISIDLSSFSSPKYSKYSRSDRYNFISSPRDPFDKEMVLAKLLKSLQEKDTVRSIKFSATHVNCDLLDHVSDFIESCSSLKKLEFTCKEFDEDFLLFLGCGVLCSLSLENITLRGKFSVGNGVLQLMQSGLMSMSLKEVNLIGSPFTEECLEWLSFSLPTMASPASQSIQLNLSGTARKSESSDNLEKTIEDLKCCSLPIDLMLDTSDLKVAR